MVCLRIRFLAGRYHATPWGHHVNEGLVEWPPSPWRLLRALTAASYRLDPRAEPDLLASLLEPLAEALPRYRVPAWAEAHTRHYMPTDRSGPPTGKTALVFDAFVAPGSGADAEDGELEVVWSDVTLDAARSALLQRLCAAIGYLGRAESWAEVTVHDAPRGEPNCLPATVYDPANDLALLAPARRAEHLGWLQHFKTEHPKRAMRAPKTLLEVLEQDTGEIRKEGWTSVPGTRWVVYDLEREQAAQVRRARAHPTPRHVLLRLAGPVLPKVERTLQVAERLHASLVSKSDQGDDHPHPVFTGVHGPGHAHVQPLSLHEYGKLDHVLVTARDGFDSAALEAIRRVRRLHGTSVGVLTVSVLGAWTDDDLTTLRPVPSALGTSRVWRSVTPFVLVRHPKLRSNGTPKLDADGTWIDGPEAQLRIELQRRGFDMPVEVRRHDTSPLRRDLRWYRFQRTRRSGRGSQGTDRGFGFEVEFAEAQTGPMLLGYARHFGLGRFEAVDVR